jgi:glutathione synthase/RimK-type ligase-like ATP-grasp enzyme
MSKKSVLIISNPDDEHTKKVCLRLNEIGIEPILFYPEQLGQNIHYSLTFPGDIIGPVQLLTMQKRVLYFDDLYAIWYRRPRAIMLTDHPLSGEGREFARDEWRATIEAAYALILELVSHVLWVSHPDNLRTAARKPLQLLLARRLGFTIPQTMITNIPEQAKAFIDRLQGDVIVKAAGNGWVYSSEGQEVTYVMTNLLEGEAREHLHEIKVAPVVFQEYVPKAYEIRANVVGQQVLAIRIDSQQSEISRVDWRRYDVSKTPYTPYTLPPNVTRQCLALTRSLGLEFGAIDLIRRPDGTYVFLEINGNGQFLWAEELSGVPVSATLAQLLAGQRPPLRSANFA